MRVNIKGVRYPCTECDYVSTSAGGLKTHIDLKHVGLIYPFDKCAKAYTALLSLRRHVRSVHDKVHTFSK